MAKIAPTHAAEQSAVVLAKTRTERRRAPAAVYKGSRLPGMARLITSAKEPCLANHRSARASDSGVRYFWIDCDQASRWPKVDPSTYRPRSPTHMPRNVAASPNQGFRRPLADKVAANKVPHPHRQASPTQSRVRGQLATGEAHVRSSSSASGCHGGVLECGR